MDTNDSSESSAIIESRKEVEGGEQPCEKVAEREIASDLSNTNDASVAPDAKSIDTTIKDNVFTTSDAKVDSKDNLIEAVEKDTVLEADIPDEKKSGLEPSAEANSSSDNQIPLEQEIAEVNKVSSTSETETSNLVEIQKSQSLQVPVSSESVEETKVEDGTFVLVKGIQSEISIQPISDEKPIEESTINPSTSLKLELVTEIASANPNASPLSVEEPKTEPTLVLDCNKSSFETEDLSAPSSTPIQVIEKPIQVEKPTPTIQVIEKSFQVLEKPTSTIQVIKKSLQVVENQSGSAPIIVEQPVERLILNPVIEKVDTKPTMPDKKLTDKAEETKEETQSITEKLPAQAVLSVPESTMINVPIPAVTKPEVGAVSVIVVSKPTVDIVPKPVVQPIPESVPKPVFSENAPPKLILESVLPKPVVHSIPVIQSLLYSSLRTPAPIPTLIQKSTESKLEVPLSKVEEIVPPSSQIPTKPQESSLQITPVPVIKQLSPSIIQARVLSQQPPKVETPTPIVTSFTTLPITQQVSEPAKIIANIIPNIETVTSTPVSPLSKPLVIMPVEAKTTKVTTIHIKPILETIPISKPTEITIEVPTTSNLATIKDTVPPLTLSKSLLVKSHTSEPITSTRIIIRPITTISTGETIKKLNIKPVIQPPTSPNKPEPIPRLIIKPVSSTRSVVEALPPKKSGEEPISRIQLHVVPASSSKDSTSQRFEITTSSAKMVPKETSLATVPKVEPLTLKRLATDQGHTVVPSKIVCPQPSVEAKASKVSETKPVDDFVIYTTTTDSPKSNLPATIQNDDLTPAKPINLEMEVAEDKDKLVPEPMDFEGDSFIDEASLNDASLPASLGENEDFSFIKPKSADLVDEVDEKNGTVPFIEEDTQSSWSLDPNKLPGAKLKDCVDPTTKVADEESRDSVASSVGSKKSTKEIPPVVSQPASIIFEYQWPPEKGEFYILQEQLCEFLGVKSFKRKHPDLPRRNVDKEERIFLKEKNVVSETQCDLGLTALRSEDVMELMSKDYAEKYQEYIRAQQEKQRQAMALKNKEYAAANLDKNKIRDLLKKAMKSASEYNAHLNQERRDERKMSFDLQTYTIHVPANRKRKLDAESTKVGKYPVALLPGQYQDYYRKYTPNELKYMPLNTVLYGPLHELSSINVPPGSDGSNSDSDGSDSEASCCSSSLGTQDGSGGDSSSGSETTTTTAATNNVKNDVYFKPKDVSSPCKICHGNHELNKQSQPEELIHCSQCKTSAHPTCLELPAELVAVIKTYEWQCMECKTCMLCMDPYDEEKMMFCDKCDRGFHTFCVGLKNLPSGRWICQLCGQCALCGSKTPGPEGTKLQWQQASGEGAKKPQLLCVACSKKKAK